MTCHHSDTSGIACRNVVRVILSRQLHLAVWHRCGIVVVVQWLHVSLTTTAIDAFNHHSFTFNLHEQTLRAGHTSLVTTTIEVTDFTLLQVPARTDSHISLVVTAKEASYLVGITARIREGGVDVHPVLKTVVVQHLANSTLERISISIRIVRINNTADHLARILQGNNGLPSNGRIIAATISIYDRTAKEFKVCLTQIRS